jgi:hypothetical protein
MVSFFTLTDYMDGAWTQRNSGPEMKDVVDEDFLRDFLGPDGKTRFREGKDEGRYAFTLCVDFFNPNSNKQAGKKVSVGIISLVCLNIFADLDLFIPGGPSHLNG